ncbi:MAG: OmpA family protein [Neisseria sp.]|nr:OmpA family protein [Neisseria sp.]
MSDNHDHKEQRMGLWLAGGAAGLAVFLTLIWSIWGWENGKIEGSPNYGLETASAVAASSEAESAEAADGMNTHQHHNHSVHGHEYNHDHTASDNDAKVIVAENGAVKFYFATGKADLAAGAEEALQNVLAGVKEGKKAVVSGYHDKTGNAAQNAELSKKRALSVREALLGFGIPEAQIELRKPHDTEAGEGAEARRVEVVLE